MHENKSIPPYPSYEQNYCGFPFTNHRNEANNYPLFTFLNWIQSNWVWYNCILKISLASIDFPCNWIIFLITFIFSQDWNILSSTADFLEDLVFNFISPSPYVIQPQLRFAWNNYLLKILPSRIIMQQLFDETVSTELMVWVWWALKGVKDYES